MKSYFISDDTFLLYGIPVATEDEAAASVFINLNENESLRAFEPVAGDIVVVAVNHHLNRKKILQKSIMPFCRVVIMLDIPINRSGTIEFPCMISKTISSLDFRRFMKVARNIPARRGTVSKKLLGIFNQLSAECSPQLHTANTGLSMRIICRIKRNIFQKYGLLNCNSQGILECHDMLRMKVPV
ncbi:hypothetical protein [Klebsiella grimontii]|uniref:hypothetical protein n=1 Tax=Klebsiella grimontii TaxID=2058152 RepID=UPI0012B71F18|nr:hypothetical protein [Klebsiella grimontii]MBZ6728270.1 hypothetical protein [Klebsiella grimontii]